MKALPILHPSEATIQDAVRLEMARCGWTLAEKTHGNAFQPGWPDLLCFHPSKGVVWVEVKRPRGRLTKAQRETFAKWAAAGLGVYVLCGKGQLDKLNGPPNWRDWLPRSKRGTPCR